MCRDIELHLGMVFHRFLSRKARRRLRLLVNGNEIRPWDPYCRGESKTKALHKVVFQLELEGAAGEVVLEPFVLPHQEDFSSPDAFRAASGPASWNQQKGSYLYRADRMIQSGGWSNLRAPDEHTKLARVAVRFPPALDEAFKISVAKMRVQLPAQIRDSMRQAINPVIKTASEVWGKRNADVKVLTGGEQASDAEPIAACADEPTTARRDDTTQRKYAPGDRRARRGRVHIASGAATVFPRSQAGQRDVSPSDYPRGAARKRRRAVLRQT